MTHIPPPIMTSGPGTFAYDTVRRRLPAVIDRVLNTNAYPADVVAALQQLRQETAGGQPARALTEDAADVPEWRALWSPYDGRTWLELPWYPAEAYFYRRLLEAVRYFAPGPLRGVDPFRAQKVAELEGHRGALAGLARALGRPPLAAGGRLPQDAEPRLSALLLFNLWGNRADLTFDAMAQTAYAGLERDHTAALLIDHRPQVGQALTGGLGRVDFINDNAGLELLFDLTLVDTLLAQGLAGVVRFHLKPQPFFVSDAMIDDAGHAIGRLREHTALRELGARLARDVESGRLILTQDPFWALPLGFACMPAPLRAELAQADLVFVKGDCNYRRLLDDRAWPHGASLAALTTYFPTDYVAIRTVKAELMIDLDDATWERLGAADAGWMTGGHYGLIQYVRP